MFSYVYLPTSLATFPYSFFFMGAPRCCFERNELHLLHNDIQPDAILGPVFRPRMLIPEVPQIVWSPLGYSTDQEGDRRGQSALYYLAEKVIQCICIAPPQKSIKSWEWDIKNWINQGCRSWRTHTIRENRLKTCCVGEKLLVRTVEPTLSLRDCAKMEREPGHIWS